VELEAKFHSCGGVAFATHMTGWSYFGLLRIYDARNDEKEKSF
jgi:hypothetical protein